MEIEVVWGTGEGGTALGAVDSALADGGIHNYNLVSLSSVVPEDAAVRETGTHERQWDVGTMVATVLAENESTVTGETIAAGLGWATAEEGGVFYEASSENADTVETLLRRGLRTAKSERPDWHWDDAIDTQVVEHTVEDNGAVIVAAVYQPL